MSATQTISHLTPSQDSVPITPFSILDDYAIHRTGASSVQSEPHTPIQRASPTPAQVIVGAIDPIPASHPRLDGVVNPSWWPTDWRRMPLYAPLNRHLDVDERPAGANMAEKTMIFIVLNGCGLISIYASIWRATFGRLNDKIFHYEIGGEY